MKLSAFPSPKPIAALALIALASLIALALLADARSARAQTLPTPTPTPSAAATQPYIELVDGKDAFPDISQYTGNIPPSAPQSETYTLDQSESGPTFTFPDGFSQDLQDGYRAVFADVHAFSQNRFGVSVDTGRLSVIVHIETDGSSGAGYCGKARWQAGNSYIYINHICKGTNTVARYVLTHEYFHILQFQGLFQIGVLYDDFTPLWMMEGSAEYFSWLWHDHADGRDPYGRDPYTLIRAGVIRGVLESNPPPLVNSSGDAVYTLGFLAIDYLTEQTGESKLIDYFTAEPRSPTPAGFAGYFQSAFGMSIDAFYRNFAAHRAAGFPSRNGSSTPIPRPPTPRPPTPTRPTPIPPTPTPTFAPIAADERIVFTSNRDEDYEIYVMYADGTSVSRLTYAAGRDIAPAWSPDGNQIAFSSNRSGDYEIYVMNANGADVSRLTNTPGEDNTPAWSPDGNQIAFTSNVGGIRDVYVMDADGSNLKRLTSHSDEDAHPTWAPDGNRIMFESHRAETWDIYVMNAADGSNVTRLTTHPQTNGDPAWSPNGRRVAFKSWRNADDEIYAMDANGASQTRLTRSNGHDGAPSWSPDGRHIVFQSERNGKSDIYVMKADGSSQTRLTDHPAEDFHPDWTSASEEPLTAAPTPTPTPTHTPVIDNRIIQLEGQVSGLQDMASAQQTQIGLMEQLIDALQTIVTALAIRVTALEGGTSTATATATPTPTPTSVPGTDPPPTPATASACIQPITPGPGVTAGAWTTTCLTANPPDDSTYYAKFYTFTLAAAAQATINLSSATAAPYLYLLEGEGTAGAIMRETGGVALRHTAVINTPLQPGIYTIEATTYHAETLGGFTLELLTSPLHLSRSQ